MESKGQPPARVYQDFEPSMEWVPEDDSDTLLVYLPDFAKEQLRVQLRARNLIISGERKLQQNTWSRFHVEFPVSGNCDLNKISAKFEGNMLFVRQPKLITLVAKPEDKPAAVATPTPTPQKPVDESNAGQKAAEVTPAPTIEPNIEKKEVGKDEDVPKTGIEGVKKETSDSDKKNKKVVDGELDKTTKTVLEKYKRAAGAFVMTLKTSSSVVNTIVVVVVGIMIGIYVSNSIKSWTKA
ncbi:hypothetical protein L1987_05288 [Smallanthus sonchifolius]|uniref:Uncharacterized protein n=1 Tax=Smallanthus sonchifolius TaxID=185202 RepID=A0ACB9JUZ6_9ASTR|nr:hypothetical protein L1987_05288 [Smallanthus sonchifolius]